METLMTTDSERMAMDDSDRREAERVAKSKPAAQKPSGRMSAAQRYRYIEVWRRICAHKGWSTKDESIRHNCVADILEASGGTPRRFSEFSQPDFGVVMWCWLEMLKGRTPSPDELKQVRENERRKNLIHVIGHLIERYGSEPAWKLLRERFKVCLIEELEKLPVVGPDGLEAIRQTLNARTYRSKH